MSAERASQPEMDLYVSNELAFELPAGGFEDQTVHELRAPLPGERSMGLMIARTPLPPGTGLGEAVRDHVATMGRNLAFHQIVAHRDLTVAGCAAIEVVSRWAHRGQDYHAREVHVAAGPVRLTFSLSAPAGQKAAGDAYLDRLVSSLELGHR